MYSEKELSNKLAELRAMASENEVVEFKEAKNNYDFRKLGKYVSALANEANLKNRIGAWLVFGIKDQGHSFVGSQYRSNQVDLMKLKKEISDQTNGGFTFREIYTISLKASCSKDWSKGKIQQHVRLRKRPL